MAKLIGEQPFHALKVDAVRHDCGDKAGFVIANLAIALDREDLAPKIGSFWPLAANQSSRREPPPLGFAFQQARAHFAKLDRPGHDPRVEHRIVEAQFLDRSARASRRSIRAASTSKWNGFSDDVVGARRIGLTAPFGVRAAGDQDRSECRASADVARAPAGPARSR